MALGKRLLLFSLRDPKAVSLHASIADWGCLATTCESLDDLRGRIEGADHDMVLIETSAALRKMLADTGDGQQLQLPLAEVEKREREAAERQAMEWAAAELDDGLGKGDDDI